MRKIHIKIKLSLFLAIIFMLLFVTKSNAAQEFTELNNRCFYIKNAYTVHYLDVKDGIAQGGTNVQQCQYNGSYAQKWYMVHLGNGEYMICSDVGSTAEGESVRLNYSLDVSNGVNANGTQIHLWNSVMNGITQTFSFTKTLNNTYIIWTKASNYTKVASLSDNLCSDGINVHQWEYSNHSHDQWIFEPVYKFENMGVAYAKANYNRKVDA